MRKSEYILPILLILISLGTTSTFAYVATTRTLTSFESILLQAFALAMGILGSFIFGRQAAGKAAREIIKPHARSAFRRLMSLYSSLHRVASIIDLAHDPEIRRDDREILATLGAIATEQLEAIDDALEDWRDLVPEDVEELDQRLCADRGERL